MSRNPTQRRIPGWISGGLVLGAFSALVWAETRRPLRRQPVEPKWVRDGRNLALAGLGALTLQILQKPVVEPLSERVARERLGLVKQANLPPWLEVPLAVVLMDYGLYLWHILTHRVPLLWRMHRVHHADLDMDASTALRFHFAELAVSIPWRAMQVRVVGAGPRTLSAWQTLTFLSILFHHSNLRLPLGVERQLVRLIVTPRMHGIHHSIIPQEHNSNWSSGLTLWDWLHGTLRLDVPQNAITIGDEAWRVPEELHLASLVAMPFRPQRSGLPQGVRRRERPAAIA